MADSKKYDGSQWEHSLRKLTTATADIEPTIYTDGTAITSYTIKGNTTQSGTPTPSNPVDVNGVGERTANLFDVNGTYSLKSDSITITNNSITATLGGSGTDRIYYTQTYTAGTYKISFNVQRCEGRLYSDKEFTGSTYNSYYGGYYRTITGTQTITFAEEFTIGVILTGAGGNNAVISNIMFQTSTSTASYEPYGYKIPISTAQTTNIYLGSTQTTRQIKKLVLTGGADETWNNAGDGTMYRSDISDYLKEAIVTSVCTHYPCNANVPSSTAAQYGVSFITSSSYNRLYIKDTSYSTATDFKNWLATEYANGTPVTIWYVLATETTATVNEPLMKIGTYADSISNAVSIPTTDGANSITVGTTVQPSEFTATWAGWHDSSVKEYDGTNWQ